jgi:phosphonate transport system substrate-binding protein
MNDRQQASDENGGPPRLGETCSAGSSRRSVLALMLGACRWLPGTLPGTSNGAPPPASTGNANNGPIRLALSESLVSDVNVNDARAAMLIWIKQLDKDLHIPIEISPKVFEPTAEIVRRARSGLFDAVGLNIIEYRQIADMLDSSQIMAETEAAEQYMLLVKRDGGIRSLGDLRGRRLSILTGIKMCIASQWLATILNEGHFAQSNQFFSSVVEEPKAARVVLPVFFGQSDACVTSKKSFDLMCELNPQVGKDLTAIAGSADLVVGFEIFHKNYRGANRDRFAHIYSSSQNASAASVARKQLSTLFHFNDLTIRDATSLEPALALLEKDERARGRPERLNSKP